ncbi:hypothetical protein ACR2RQ_003566 [Cronobacter dublinensis]
MVSKTERFIRVAFIVAVAAIQGAIIWGCITKNSDAANWIIAGANVAMAVAAYAAYRSAKRYLTEFFAKEGYTLAINMVNNNLIELNVDNKLLTTCSTLVTHYKNNDQKPYRDVDVNLLKSSLNLLQSVYRDNDNWKKNIARLEKQMLSYGITASPHKASYLTEMVLSLDKCLINVYPVMLHLFDEIKRCEKRQQSGSNLSERFVTTNESDLDGYLADLSLNWNKMTACYKSFFEGDRHIKSLFSVRMREN